MSARELAPADKVEAFGIAAEEAFPEQAPFFRSDEERRAFLARQRRELNRLDHADRRHLLANQHVEPRPRPWFGTVELLAALMTIVAGVLLFLPVRQALRGFLGLIVCAFLVVLIAVCHDIRQEQKARRDREGRK